MSLQDFIDAATQLKKSESEPNFTYWPTEVKSNKKEILKPRGKGEMPFHLESNNENQGRTYSNGKHKKKSSPKQNQYTQDQQASNKIIQEIEFNDIVPSVREVNGGWNTQSNDVIEKRFKERQRQLTQNQSDENSSSDCNAMYTTVSSETNGSSYKTTMQDSYELYITSQQCISEKIARINAERYKKNALIKSLITNANNTDPTNQQNSNVSSAAELDTSGSLDKELAELSVNDNKESLQEDRLNLLLFRSKEDEDVYVHPLRERVQDDPEWKNMRLSRKGTEVTFSSRQYYMNIENDCFEFEPHQANL